VDKHHEQHHFDYLYRPFRLTRCVDGVVKRQPHDLQVRIAGQPRDVPLAIKIVRQLGLAPRPWPDQVVDLEFLVLPGGGRFTSRAECRVAVLLEETPAAARECRSAHVVLSRDGQSGSPRQLKLKLGDTVGLWSALGGGEHNTQVQRAA
jgi:hypothetical protein